MSSVSRQVHLAELGVTEIRNCGRSLAESPVEVARSRASSRDHRGVGLGAPGLAMATVEFAAVDQP